MPAPRSLLPGFLVAIAALATSTVLQAAPRTVHLSPDGRAIGISAATPGVAVSPARAAAAGTRLPMLQRLSQVPGYGGISSQAYGTGNQPFTTKAAYSAADQPSPVILPPWRATGKLIMEFGLDTFVCTASVIRKSLLVTAAHCVWNFGDTEGFADAVTFQPALHDTRLRYGEWTASTWYVPSSYADGTDVCTTSGVVCENDLAVVVLDTGTGAFAGRAIADVVGRYGYYTKNQGYVMYANRRSAQITQLGYPAAFDNGLRMIRTDAIGYQDAPNNVIIGSAQTGGSSGGPWLMNFGTAPTTAEPAPTFNDSNRVVGTTSWGFNDGVTKLQGASRFGNNTAFPAPGATNIDFLVNFACGEHPAACN